MEERDHELRCHSPILVRGLQATAAASTPPPAAWQMQLLEVRNLTAKLALAEAACVADIACPLCSCQMRQPVVCSPCGHACCAACLEAAAGCCQKCTGPGEGAAGEARVPVAVALRVAPLERLAGRLEFRGGALEALKAWVNEQIAAQYSGEAAAALRIN